MADPPHGDRRHVNDTWNIRAAVGTTPSSWGVWFPRDPCQPPWQMYLDQAVQAGYEWVELGPYGYLPTDGKLLDAELRARGLRASCAHTRTFLDLPTASAWPDVERQVNEVGGLLAAVGARYLLILPASYRDPVAGEVTGRRRLTPHAWDQLLERLHRIADLVRHRYGLRLVFHPHIETPVEHADQIETLLARSDPDRVALCLDTGHCAYRDTDALVLLRRHHERIPYLHVKDVNPTVHRTVKEAGLSFGEAVKRAVFCEPPTGAFDFLALRDLLHTLAFDGLVIVEQGMYPLASFDIPLPFARRTRAYLRSIGIG